MAVIYAIYLVLFFNAKMSDTTTNFAFIFNDRNQKRFDVQKRFPENFARTAKFYKQTTRNNKNAKHTSNIIYFNIVLFGDFTFKF